MDKDVLIADDSEFMRDLLREILEERYRVSRRRPAASTAGRCGSTP
jgi:PleD family two-component response regulator